MLKSGHTLYQNNSETNYSIGGVAFLINNKIEHLITKYQAISDRVIYIILKISKRYDMQLIHCYVPTSSSEDKSIEKLYEHIDQARTLENTYYTVVTGDFNAKIGNKQQHD